MPIVEQHYECGLNVVKKQRIIRSINPLQGTHNIESEVIKQ